jgi:hypothetical protein
MVISEDLHLDGTTLAAGSIVTTLAGGDSFVGDNNIEVNNDEIIYLTVNSTTMGSGTTSADATVLFDGGDIGLNNNQKKMRSLAIIEEISVVDNVDPVVALPSGPINYTELDPATLLDPGATLVDPDSADFGGGLLLVDLETTGSLDDRLSIRHEGTGAGQIGISGADVTYGGIIIGTLAGGTNGTVPLTVAFNTNADASAVQAVLRNVTYENVSSTPTTTQRMAKFTLTDGDSGVSNPVVKVIVVNEVNAAPVLSGANDLAAIDEDDFTNGGTLVSDLLSGWVTDADPGAIAGIAAPWSASMTRTAPGSSRRMAERPGPHSVPRTAPRLDCWLMTPSSASYPMRTGTAPWRTESPSTRGTRRAAPAETPSISPDPTRCWISSTLCPGATMTAPPRGLPTGSSSMTTVLRPRATYESRTASCAWTAWTAAPRKVSLARPIFPPPLRPL